MPEQEAPYFFKGHNFDLREFRRDLYRLLCQFEASEKIAYRIAERCGSRISPEAGKEILEERQTEFFTDEVSRILLQTAICVRLLDAESEADPDATPCLCGTLEQPLGAQSQALTLREACNKLIHTAQIRFDVEDVPWTIAVPMAGIGWVQPRVFLYASRRRTEWKATVELLDFVRESASILQYRPLAESLRHEQAE